MLLQLLIFVISSLVCVNAKFCEDVFIRNQVSEFEVQLRGCTVIVGNLEIALIEAQSEETDFARLHFPELREVRGYFVLFRIFEITTLSHIFPNLTIIRGLQQFKGYSFVLQDLPRLTEIGLYNLKHIQRGSTRIEMCPDLCHVNTLNWTLIGGPSHKLDYYDMKKAICAGCPDNCNGTCWTPYHCQQKTPDNCHSQCLGCTAPYSATKCLACRNYEDNGICVSECPKHKVRHEMTLTCLTPYECFSRGGTWWSFDGECVDRCPANYTVVQKVHSLECEFCGENCKRTCLGIEIGPNTETSILHGCTHINGSLSIRTECLKSTRRLYSDLGMIEEIDGFLRIHRSRVLSSLKFLKNLKIIHGTKLYNDNHAFVVFKNSHLTKLLNDNHKVEIKNGTVNFHDNPKLCFPEIERLAKNCNVTYTEFDVSPFSNGDQKYCRQIELKMNVVKISSTSATIVWENIAATRKIKPPVGYSIAYIQNSADQPDYYDEYSPFYESSWETEFVTDINTYQIQNLVPSTEYVYYITLYTDNTEKDGQSQLGYFKTRANNPSELLHLTATSTASDSVRLNWELPAFPNGILDRYKLVVYYERDDEGIIAQRDFCKHPFFIKPDVKNSTECCKHEETLYEMYKKYLEEKKKTPEYEFTCDTLNMEMTGDSTFGTCKNYMFAEESSLKPEIVPSSVFPTNSSNIIEMTIKDATVTNYNVKPLKHFSMFIFLLKVCHKDSISECSSPVMTFQRTLPKEDADDISPRVSVKLINMTGINMRWSEPKQPNAMIVAYELEYKRTDQENFTLFRDCVTRDEYVRLNHNFQIEKFPPGRYAIRVRAVSLAGPGKFTPFINFKIPSHPISLLVAIPFIIGMIGLVIGIVIGILYCRHKFYTSRRRRSDDEILLQDMSLRYPGGSWEVPMENIMRGDVIFQGSFITVMHGFLSPPGRECLIKTISMVNYGQKNLFLEKIEPFKFTENINFVIKLIGVVSEGNQPFALMEKPTEDLKSNLRRLKANRIFLTVPQRHELAFQIADGMAFLASKGFVHKDIATRNCLIFPNGLVKVGDYGVSEDIYREDYFNISYRHLIPVRWMAPETLHGQDCTTESDVWSYGVFLWELVTSAILPYEYRLDREVFDDVRGGQYLTPCGDDLMFTIMTNCWKPNPRERIMFKNIVELLVPTVGPRFHTLSYHLSTPQGRRLLPRYEPSPRPGPSRPRPPPTPPRATSMPPSLGDYSDDEF